MEIIESKICGYCKHRLPISVFHKKPTNAIYPKDGFQWACKKCNNEKRKHRRKQNPDLRKHEALRDNFGITLDEYKAKLLQQRGVCAICGQPEMATFRGKVKTLSVDHNHKTNLIRGLLCDKCNHLLGNANEGYLFIMLREVG